MAQTLSQPVFGAGNQSNVPNNKLSAKSSVFEVIGNAAKATHHFLRGETPVKTYAPTSRRKTDVSRNLYENTFGTL